MSANSQRRVHRRNQKALMINNTESEKRTSTVLMHDHALGLQSNHQQWRCARMQQLLLVGVYVSELPSQHCAELHHQRHKWRLRAERCSLSRGRLKNALQHSACTRDLLCIQLQ